MEFSYFPRLWLLEWGCNGLKIVTKGLRDVNKGGISARKAGLLLGLSMKKSTLQVRLNRRVTFHRRIKVPYSSFLFKNKKWRKTVVCRLANRGFGMSTDAFLKSVKKFLGKEVRIIPFLKQPLASPVICYVLFHDARLYFWNRLPDYFASAREAYKSLACRNLCTIIFESGYWTSYPDTGQHRSSAKMLISRWKQREKKLNCLSSY